MKKSMWFYIIGAFWLFIILGYIGYKEFTLQTGDEIVLKTQPVDPRDLFRGDYVILSYEISSLSSDLASFKVNEGETVYVALGDEGGFGVATSIQKSCPEGPALKGRVTSSGSGRIRLEYGIESYFVQEKTGRYIEQYRGRGLEVVVAVDDFCKGVIKGLQVDGEPI